MTWAASDDADLKHPLLAEYVKWKRQGNVNAVKDPRKAWRYWELEPAANSVTVINYNDSDDRTKRRPGDPRKAGRRGRRQSPAICHAVRPTVRRQQFVE